jgi:hypothetical protein
MALTDESEFQMTSHSMRHMVCLILLLTTPISSENLRDAIEAPKKIHRADALQNGDEKIS